MLERKVVIVIAALSVSAAMFPAEAVARAAHRQGAGRAAPVSSNNNGSDAPRRAVNGAQPEPYSVWYYDHFDGNCDDDPSSACE